MTSDLPPSGGSAPEQGTTTSGPGSPTPPPPPQPPPSPGPPGTPGYPPPGAGPNPTPNPTPNPLGAQFFDSLRRIGVYRPDGGRWFAGVAAGLSRRWGVDALLVRGVLVALTIVGGIGLLLYGLAWLFLPQDDGRIHAQQVLSGDVTAGFFGAVVATLFGLGADGGGGPWGWYGWGFPGGLVLTALIVGGIIYWASRNQRPNPTQPYPAAGPAAESRAEAPGTAVLPPTPTPTLPPALTSTPPPVTQPYGSAPAFGQPPAGPPPGSNPGGYPFAPQASRRSATAPSRRITRATFGLALLAGVGGFLASGAGDYGTGEQVLIGLSAALAVVAVGVIVSGLAGRRTAGLAGIGVLLAAVTLIGTAAHNEGISQDQSFVVAGERVWTPTTPAEASDGISQGVGELTVRLTDPALQLEPGVPVTVPVRIGAGRILLVLPESVPARITIDQGGGQVVDVTGRTAESHGGAGNHQLTYTTGPVGDPVLEVSLRQGAGEIEMQTEPVAGTPSPTGANQ